MSLKHYICFIYFVFCFKQVFGLSSNKMEGKILETLLRDYDATRMPDNSEYTNVPVDIKTNFYVLFIKHICSKDMEFSVQLFYRQEWLDKRLKYENMNDQSRNVPYLSLSDPNKIWTPDVFFTNSRKARFHDVLKPNLFIRISPSGKVFYSTRVSLDLFCPMDLKHFPFDKQTCSIITESYGYGKDRINVMWSEKPIHMANEDLHSHDFTLLGYNASSSSVKISTGEYSFLKADFSFLRKNSKYIYQWYFPTGLLTLISFISFWLNPKKFPRITLLVSTLLLLCYKIDRIQEKAPPVSYYTAIDCWTETCFLFTLVAFIQYWIVCFISKKVTSNKINGKKSDQAIVMKLLVDNEGNHIGEKQNQENGLTQYSEGIFINKFKNSSLVKKIDYICAILFPVLFILYIIVYFIYFK